MGVLFWLQGHRNATLDFVLTIPTSRAKALELPSFVEYHLTVVKGTKYESASAGYYHKAPRLIEFFQLIN